MRTLPKLKVSVVLSVVTFLMCLIAPAAASRAASAQAVSQAYQTSGPVQKGMIVMIDPGDSAKVKPLTVQRESSMLGVVVAANDTVLSLGSDQNVSQVYVAAKGKYEVLVSNENGDIRPGDLVSVSSLDGIGMRADDERMVIVGRALKAFDGDTQGTSKAELTTAGKKRQVSIAPIELDISVSHNPLASAKGTSVPSFLQKTADTIAGRPVSALRVYTSAVVLAAVLIITSSLLFSGVRTSLASLGRNPLARTAILRGLLQVIIISLIIFSFGLFAIYLLLRI